MLPTVIPAYTIMNKAINALKNAKIIIETVQIKAELPRERVRVHK